MASLSLFIVIITIYHYSQAKRSKNSRIDSVSVNMSFITGIPISRMPFGWLPGSTVFLSVFVFVYYVSQIHIAGTFIKPFVGKRLDCRSALATSLISSLGCGGLPIHERKNRKFRTLNPLLPAVYMSYLSLNFRLLHASNLSVLNFRIVLLIYPESLGSGTRLCGVPSIHRAAEWMTGCLHRPK